jgi:hypothetical protein
MPLDYSKWKDIEVSDDEDETHPNIDTASLFRWRHQARMERMEKAKQTRDEMEYNKKEFKSQTEVSIPYMPQVYEMFHSHSCRKSMRSFVMGV